MAVIVSWLLDKPIRMKPLMPKLNTVAQVAFAALVLGFGFNFKPAPYELHTVMGFVTVFTLVSVSLYLVSGCGTCTPSTRTRLWIGCKTRAEICVGIRVRPRQLAFALPHAESLTRDNFLEGPAMRLLFRWSNAGRIGRAAYCRRARRGSGKSHLAAIWAERAGARAISAGALTSAADHRRAWPGHWWSRIRRRRLRRARAVSPPQSRARGGGGRPSGAHSPIASRSSCAISGRGCAPHPSCRYYRRTTCCFAADRQILRGPQLGVDEPSWATSSPGSTLLCRHARGGRSGSRLGRPVTRALAVDLLATLDRLAECSPP